MLDISKAYDFAVGTAAPSVIPVPVQNLRRAIRAIEGRHIETDAAAAALPLGITAIDEALGGGLLRCALHEVAAASEAQVAAATGFALALAQRAAENRTVLWIAEEMALRESGVPYGPGLDEVGLAPERVIVVVAADARDVLWAMEEGLRCRAIGAAIGELRTQRIDGVAGRRLSLAAMEHKTCGLLLRARPDPSPLPAATRWLIGAQSAAKSDYGTGPPALQAHLTRNRCGPVGSWVLEWNRAEQRFDLAATHPEPVAPAAADRPHPAARVA
jgi:protein ImuA